MLRLLGALRCMTQQRLGWRAAHILINNVDLKTMVERFVETMPLRASITHGHLLSARAASPLVQCLSRLPRPSLG